MTDLRTSRLLTFPKARPSLLLLSCPDAKRGDPCLPRRWLICRMPYKGFNGIVRQRGWGGGGGECGGSKLGGGK